MRVTQCMLDRNVLFSIAKNMDYLEDLNRQLSTGMKVNTISDDVPAAAQILELQRENAKIESGLRNLETANAMLSTATSAFQSASASMASAKQLAVQGATGTYTDVDRKAMAQEVDQILETILGLTNCRANGEYVFSGEAFDAAPFQTTRGIDGRITAVDYVGAVVSTEALIAPSRTTEMNLVGKMLWTDQGDVFQGLIDLRDALETNNVAGIQAAIPELETAHDDIRTAAGLLGARQNELQMLRNTLTRFSEINTAAISERQDADIPEISVEYSRQMTVLQAVMKLAANVFPPSLANYI